jgi:hypothetical protein
VAAREAACAASERQLAQRLAQLSLHERLLQERAARVVALEHDMQVCLSKDAVQGTRGRVVLGQVMMGLGGSCREVNCGGPFGLI